MKNKLLFIFILGFTITLHAYVLQTTKVKQHVIAVNPQKKVSPIINLQRVSIKKLEPIVEPVKEIVPEPPLPVVEEVVVVPPKIIKKKALKKVVKKPIKQVKKIVKKKKIIKKKKRLIKKKTKKKIKKVSKVASKMQRSSPKQKAIKNTYLAQVRRMIEERKKYPKSSKRLKQEGTAYVKFTIASNGKIHHIGLEKKCPFSKLNKAAVKILKSIGTFTPIPKGIGVQHLSLTIPITYKILN